MTTPQELIRQTVPTTIPQIQPSQPTPTVQIATNQPPPFTPLQLLQQYGGYIPPQGSYIKPIIPLPPQIPTRTQSFLIGQISPTVAVRKVEWAATALGKTIGLRTEQDVAKAILSVRQAEIEALQRYSPETFKAKPLTTVGKTLLESPWTMAIPYGAGAKIATKAISVGAKIAVAKTGIPALGIFAKEVTLIKKAPIIGTIRGTAPELAVAGGFGVYATADILSSKTVPEAFGKASVMAVSLPGAALGWKSPTTLYTTGAKTIPPIRTSLSEFALSTKAETVLIPKKRLIPTKQLLEFKPIEIEYGAKTEIILPSEITARPITKADIIAITPSKKAMSVSQKPILKRSEVFETKLEKYKARVAPQKQKTESVFETKLEKYKEKFTKQKAMTEVIDTSPFATTIPTSIRLQKAGLISAQRHALDLPFIQVQSQKQAQQQKQLQRQIQKQVQKQTQVPAIKEQIRRIIPPFDLYKPSKKPTTIKIPDIVETPSKKSPPSRPPKIPPTTDIFETPPKLPLLLKRKKEQPIRKTQKSMTAKSIAWGEKNPLPTYKDIFGA